MLLLRLIFLHQFRPLTGGTHKRRSRVRGHHDTPVAHVVGHDLRLASEAATSRRRPRHPEAVGPAADVAVAVAARGHSASYDYDKDHGEYDQEEDNGDKDGKDGQQPHRVVGRQVRGGSGQLFFSRLKIEEK